MKQRTRRRLQNYGVLLIILLCLGWVAVRFWGFTSSTFTDNAHVERRIIPIISRVQGFVKEVRYNDYSYVHAGDTLVVIDDSEYRLHLARARADLARAGAGRSATGSSVSATESNAGAADAAVAETRVLLEQAERDLQRHEGLLAGEAVTRQQYEDVKARRDALHAQLTMLTRRSRSAMLATAEQRGRLGQDEAGMEMAQAAIELAQLNCGYTVVTAPADGWCSRRTIEPGQMVNPGTVLLDLTDASTVWVTANYREKQTARMQVGDSVRVEVDAVPGVTFHGVVESLAPATGARAAGRTQETAMGNFVRVEQRIPVKVLLPESCNSAESLQRLRAGMNAECRITD